MLVGPHLHETIDFGNAFNLSAAETSIGTAKVNGESINVSSKTGRMISFFVSFHTISGEELTFRVEESADNSTFTTVKKISASSTDISFETAADAQDAFIGSIPFSHLASTTKYVRLTATGSAATCGGAAASYAISDLYSPPGSASDKFFSDTVFATAGQPT